ncbi:TPA: phenylalanine--tRNA ligase subunit beta [Candidatus Collierbacteria bacterium]|uniref:phenylalanine--tRNA ligase n=1 Tax=Candidatus Collierbacteria bacterium GW2011_GWB2_44_22 TaxID=1618387 RepID=A0A0G1HYG0_9BACT|nr:MAG: Phenylalanine-tRNA ligase beta subunit [Candidatus Collierbacteria bacterium GW2011_GWA2_44_13]KKT51552.1 MAG: Phenylalanine-tRNA ligase beta subunit [Candidatus Collierbacteria bacterium GW2011_GWB1_44_197]KKT51995.1 MAG: Phenylalanine-tRNA ligase beta subunit [Candidatus Collierbacteria bacterium GW2011_GWB2_44_22]KKT62147.1 MAG: Phenylalanine-tRNA ligase beta subunit [Candidatus Collierbacteria bacterium GW2011_GWD1_44_27]KKT66717.1 MAG: Phenylalanine-tRNA ligase beta subunit [Candid
MDIVITDSSIRKFLDTPADSEMLSQNVSLCGPTFDRIKKIDGDFVYEIEAITNRVDTASAQGVAREAATILTQFNIPAKFINDPYKENLSFPDSQAKQFNLNIERDLVIRLVALSLENISVKPSSKETQSFLENCGQRPLNNCVDITNELTLLYGLPSHIFDLDKLAAQNLTIRESKRGESITTLDDKKNILIDGDIVIEDGSDRLVDLCGIMGGQVAEVDDHTKNILLIVPVYNPQKIRKTSLRLQKRTLAAQIFEKQPDPELCLPVLSKAVQLFKERTGAVISSPLFDYYPANRSPKIISLDFNWLNTFVGLDIKKETVIDILASLGFGGTKEGNGLACSVPSWRYHDINIREDLAEEVARIYGYFRLPSVLPCVNLPAEPKNHLFKTELKSKIFLSDIGYHEIYNNSLISLQAIEKSGQDSSRFIKLKNSLSQDFEYLRTSLIPSALENHKHNQGKADKQIKTFEIANCYQKTEGQELPKEISYLAILSEGDYRKTKGDLEALFQKLRVKDISFEPSKVLPPFYNTVATADIYSEKLMIGYIGSIKSAVSRNFGLTNSLIATEINLDSLVSKISQEYVYHPISEYPSIIEDLTVASEKSLGDIIEAIKSTSKLVKDIQYLDSFKGKHSFRISFQNNEKNLEQAEINSLKEIILDLFKV